MLVKLLQASALNILVEAIRTCYHSQNESDNLAKKDIKLIKAIIDAGHTSTLEHIVYTFKIEGISRVCLAQLTRHRMASYSVESQRYVEVSDYVVPELPREISSHIKSAMETLNSLYRFLLDAGINKDMARYILPQASATNLVMTINARSLINFFNLRLDKSASLEIQELAKLMYKVLPDYHKEAIFYDFKLER